MIKVFEGELDGVLDGDSIGTFCFIYDLIGTDEICLCCGDIFESVDAFIDDLLLDRFFNVYEIAADNIACERND